MSDTTFDAHIEEMQRTIDACPEHERARLAELVEETRKRHGEVQESGRRSLIALADWRLFHKYLLFDIQARLRESQAGEASGADESEE